MSCTDTDTDLTVFYSSHPQKRVNSMLCVRFCFLSHAVQRFTQWRRIRRNYTKWLLKKNTKKGLAEFVNIFFKCCFHLLCYASRTRRRPLRDLLTYGFFFGYFSFINAQTVTYFDEATVLLYFAQSIFFGCLFCFVLVWISTNPLSAELRRRINNGKEGRFFFWWTESEAEDPEAPIVLRNGPLYIMSQGNNTQLITCK